tara:strand:- start:1516 stop:2034 length:519 start_codon:yes stop_codon:yes gene_type:complete
MIERKIFQRKKSKTKFIIITLALLFFIMVVYYLFLDNKDEFVIIPENKKPFYIIPEDRGGQKVENLDKKSLNLKSLESINEKVNFPNDLLFSIQFFSDTKYENVNNYLKKIINSKETIYQIEDFYILALSTEIGIDYFLIYKNFDTRQEAQDYCLNYLSKIENCLIVDTTKF